MRMCKEFISKVIQMNNVGWLVFFLLATTSCAGAKNFSATLSPSSYNDSVTVEDSSPTSRSFGDNFNADPCRFYGNCDDCVHDVCSAKNILTKQLNSTSICLYCLHTDPPTPSGGCVLSDSYRDYCTGDVMNLTDASVQQCTAASHSEELSCSAISERNGYFVDLTSSKKESHSLIQQQSLAHGEIGYFNYDVSVALCEETTAFSSDLLGCFQKANAPVQVRAYPIDHILSSNYDGSNAFCWNVGTVSQRSKPRFTKESEDDFEITIDYGNMPCCPWNSDGPGNSHNVSLTVKIIPASQDHCGLEKPDHFKLLNSSNLVAMMLNCSFSPHTSATVYFETNLFCPERLFVALDTDKTSFECSEHLGGYLCRIVPSPLKNVSNYQPKCNSKQFRITVQYKSNNSKTVWPNSVKTNCTFSVDSSNVEMISVEYGLIPSSKTSGWTTIKGHLPSPSRLRLPILYIGLISGGGAIVVLISVLVVVYVKRRKSRGTYSTSVKSEEVWHVVCLNMPSHNRLMKTKVTKVLYAIDKRIKIFDLKALKCSSVDRLTEAVKKCSLVLIGAGENASASEEEIANFRSDALIAFSEKRGRREEQVVPVLLNGSPKDVLDFLQHLNALDLRNRKDNSYKDEIARLETAVRGVFAGATST